MVLQTIPNESNYAQNQSLLFFLQILTTHPEAFLVVAIENPVLSCLTN